VPTPYGQLVPLFQSDSMEIVTATIAPGQNLMLDPVDNRELMVSRGDVTVVTLDLVLAGAVGAAHRPDRCLCRRCW
jgi:hypothetical protein